MAIKIQYPVQLHPETKCPSCTMPITSIGPQLYACQSGHVLEALVLVTMRPKQKQDPVKVVGPKEITDDNPYIPEKFKSKVTQ